jgi:signal transduction histidine kinase
LVEHMREDLTRAMVHDLRNPLTGIFGALKLLNRTLDKDLLTSSQQQIFGLMQSSTERMLALVNAILDISKLESGRMPIVYTPIALAKLTQQVLSAQMPLGSEKDISLQAHVPENLPRVWADEELIARVLQNLVGNAIKFTPREGRVQIEARRNGSDRSRIRMCVSDTGTGVPQEVQERLFQKFAAGQQQGRGSGLGLAFCKMVVEAHGEHIWLERTSERGTIFCFTLSFEPDDRTQDNH